MGEYINIQERINQIDPLIKIKEEELLKSNLEWQEINNKKKRLHDELRSLGTEKEMLLAQLGQSEIAHKFIAKYKDQLEYKYAGKMDSPEHGFANCNKCLVPLELFKGNTGIGEVEIGACPKCEIEINFTDYSNW